MYKHMRVDEELLKLVKRYIKILEKDTGAKYSQAAAVKVALKKVLK